MPIYEYACPKCGEFEITQRITDRPLTKCPTCKSKVRKLMSSTSFQLKGSGWYATDYGGKKSSAGSDTAAPKESGSSDSSASGDRSSKASGGETKATEKTAPAKKTPAAQNAA